MAGGLERGHHELILLRDLLLLALLGLHLSNFILDVTKVDVHGLIPTTLLSVGAIDVLSDDGLGTVIMMPTDVLTHLLLDRESDASHLKLTVAIVNLELAFGRLLGREHVLVELGLEAGGALRAASPSLELGCLADLLVGLELDSLLTDGEHLLVLHVLLLVLALENGLAVVLDLSRGLLSVAFVLEVEAGWDAIGQVS